ncbi:MAG: hypothetical protein MUF83_18435, partial [Acidimicrobiales bacterium]|nr:hypothetical protein [Acidimicrobiales bacterium]
VNLLAPDGPDRIDPASGMAHLTGIPVEVRPAAGPLDPTDWSGIAAAERATLPLAGSPAVPVSITVGH